MGVLSAEGPVTSQQDFDIKSKSFPAFGWIPRSGMILWNGIDRRMKRNSG